MFNNCPSLALLTLMIGSTLAAAQPQSETPGMEPAKFRPKGFTGKLTPYDLEQVFQENKKKAAMRQAHNYSSFLVTEFSRHHYPGATFAWHRAGSVSRNVGIRTKDENTDQEVYLSWFSLSDGLQWGFFNAEIHRTRKADLFAIIPNAEVADKIQQNLRERKLLTDTNEVSDVFSYQTRSITTAQRTSGLMFPDREFGETKYGVAIEDNVYFFNSKGNQAN